MSPLPALWKSCVTLILWLAFAMSADATTYYVATNGRDDAAGTRAAPFATITRAASSAVAGDVVTVRSGVYYEVVHISAHGDEGEDVIIRSEERAVIDGSRTKPGTNLIQLHDVRFLELSGFEVRNAKNIGISGYAAQHVIISDNIIHDCARNGIYIGSTPTIRSTDVVIDGNDVFHTVTENRNHRTNAGWAQAIGVDGVDGARITNNRVHENDGNGIDYVLSSGGCATGNELYDNFSTSFYLDNAQRTSVEGNLIYSTGNTRYFRRGLPAHGIGLANEHYDTSNPLDDITITNNLVLHSNWAIFYGAYDEGGGLRNVTISNNRFIDAARGLLVIQRGPHADTLVENNVFYQIGDGPMQRISGGGVTLRNNVWQRGK